MFNVVTNVTFPVTHYLFNHKTEIKLLVLYVVARYIHKKVPQIKESWANTAVYRSIGKFAINQYFETPSSKQLMQEQQEKYDNLYTKHYSRNATTIACKFSLNSVESLITNTFNSKMKQIRAEIQSIKSLQQNEEIKYSLFKQLFCIGVCRSISFIFMNTMYHILFHIVFAMIARRNLYKNKNKHNEIEDQRKLFQLIHIFHEQITENYAQILMHKMDNILIKHNNYKLNRCFESINDLKSMLFEDIITASLDAFNSLKIRSMIDIETILIHNKQKLYHKCSNFMFCEMFYELNSIVKCNDFALLFMKCLREYIQFWFNDLLNQKQQNGKKLRYLNIMNYIIANYDNLMKLKNDVYNGLLDVKKSKTESVSSWDIDKLCNFIHEFNPMLANMLYKLGIDGNQIYQYDYLDILNVTKLHEFYLPKEVWQNIAFQLTLPCVNDNQFIKHKQKQRTALHKKQSNILTRIHRLKHKTKLLQMNKQIMQFDNVYNDDDDDDDDDDNKYGELDKFDAIFEKWAKYLLRLNEFVALKEFLNIVSGFDLVSSKSDYFVDDNCGLDIMGEYKVFDWKKSVNDKWNSFINYLNQDS